MTPSILIYWPVVTGAIILIAWGVRGEVRGFQALEKIKELNDKIDDLEEEIRNKIGKIEASQEEENKIIHAIALDIREIKTQMVFLNKKKIL